MSGTERYLSFRLDGEHYCFPLLKVREVIAVPETTQVPHAPAYFRGIMNLRGQVISVLDLSKKLSLPEKKDSAATAVIIVDMGTLQVGVVVDSVESVMSAEPKETSPAPELNNARNAQFVAGVIRKEDRLVILLDVAMILDLNDRRAIAQKAA